MTFKALIAICQAASSSAAVAEPSPELMAVWEKDWEARTDKIVSGFVKEFSEPLRQPLDPAAATSAVNELRAGFQSVIRWDVFSGLVVETIASHCSADVLEKIEPYLLDEADSPVDETLLRDYSVCHADAMGAVEAAAILAIVRTASTPMASRHEAALADYQRILPTVTAASVEKKYGALLDEIAALLDISALSRQDQRVVSLTDRLENDPVVIHVSLRDGDYPRGRHTIFRFYQDGEPPSGSSCHGTSTPEQRGLTRCSWRSGRYNQDNVIRYKRRITDGDRKRELVIEFDYDRLLEALRQ